MSRKKNRAKIKLKEAPKMNMPSNWDAGATGPANQINLRTEPATDIDPETGRETPNPNGIKRRRREDWAARYHRQGHLTPAQFAAACKLRNASEGMRDRDPLAAIGEVRVRSGCKLAAYVDARRYFHELWTSVPTASRKVVERVVIDDAPLWNSNAAQRERHMLRLQAGLDAIA